MSVEIDYDLLVDSIDMDQLAALIAGEIDEESIAGHIDADDVAEHIDVDDVARSIDASDIADHFSAHDIACELDAESISYAIAEHYLDTDDVIEKMGSMTLSEENIQAIAKNIESDRIGSYFKDPWSMMVSPAGDSPTQE